MAAVRAWEWEVTRVLGLGQKWDGGKELRKELGLDEEWDVQKELGLDEEWDVQKELGREL